MQLISRNNFRVTNFFFSFAVKYLREVTPYFRRSALNDVGWGGPDSRENSLNKTNKRTIPLKLCYLCRNLTMVDNQSRTFELHSPDAKSSCILRCPDDHIASQWFSSIHTLVDGLCLQAMAEANHVLLNSSSHSMGEIKHMGWLAEQVCFFYCLMIIPHGKKITLF